MQRAAAFNRSPGRRAAAAALLGPAKPSDAAAVPPTPVVVASAWQASGAFTANGTPTAAVFQARPRWTHGITRERNPMHRPRGSLPVWVRASQVIPGISQTRY